MRAARARAPQLFDTLGLHIDASSGYEVQRAMSAGIAASKARICCACDTRARLRWR